MGCPELAYLVHKLLGNQMCVTDDEVVAKGFKRRLIRDWRRLDKMARQDRIARAHRGHDPADIARPVSDIEGIGLVVSHIDILLHAERPWTGGYACRSVLRLNVLVHVA